MSTPIETIRDYYKYYGSSEKPNELLSFLLDSVLCSPDADEWSHKQRCEIIFFFWKKQKVLGTLFELSSSILQLFATLNQKQ